VHHRTLLEKAGVGGEELGGKIVGALDHDVDLAHELPRVFRQKSPANQTKLGPRTTCVTAQARVRRIELVSAHVLGTVQDLPVQIALVHHVVVAQDQLAHAGTHQRERRRATEPAEPDEKNAPAGCRLRMLRGQSTRPG
jgi:hypothetical protein